VVSDARRSPEATGTRYLPAGRTEPTVLAAEIARAAASPVVTAVLEAAGSAAAVVDPRRQIVAVNSAYLQLLGIDQPEQALGLRPGEALACAHAQEGPDGCGTGPACASCGQAVAALIAGRTGHPADRTCYLARRWNGGEQHYEFQVRAAPIEIDGFRGLVVALTDVTQAARRAALHRTFLHDLANLATGLRSVASELKRPGEQDLVGELQLLCEELVREVELQRILAGGRLRGYAPARRMVEVARALDVLRCATACHPACRGRRIEIEPPPPGAALVTDPTPLQHVLVNMAINALEATPAGGTVRVKVEDGPEAISFRVWNAGAIPAAVVPRIFQRHFTTKRGEGRGHGTHAMKLFGEVLLGGRVHFTTSAQEGTWFQLDLERGHAGRSPEIGGGGQGGDA
jgi:hypothetical protein